jgi:hypothetical protein
LIAIFRSPSTSPALLTPIHTKAPDGAFLFVLVDVSATRTIALIGSHDSMYVSAVTSDQVIRVATSHVAAGMNNKLRTVNGTIQSNSSSHTMRGGHDLLLITHTPGSHHAVALIVHARSPFPTVGHWIPNLVLVKIVFIDF